MYGVLTHPALLWALAVDTTQSDAVSVVVAESGKLRIEVAEGFRRPLVVF